MEDNSKVKNRIIALLAKTTENGATQQEMESALAKANQLMLENFISEHDLRDESLVKSCELLKVELIPIKYDLTALYGCVAKLFECEYYYNNTHVCFFGHTEDTELCSYFYNLIIRACLRAKKRYMLSYEFRVAKKNFHAKTLTSGFMKGFIIEICAKMEVLYKDRESKIPPGYGLMVIEKKKKVKDGFKNLNLKIHSSPSRTFTGEREAMLKGIEAAEDFNIVQGLNDGQKENTNLLN